MLRDGRGAGAANAAPDPELGWMTGKSELITEDLITLGRPPASALGVKGARLLEGALQIGIGEIADLRPATV
jgi:hypothetical protein